MKQRDWEVLPSKAGLQHFTWDLRCRGVKTLPDEERKISTRTGYLVPPGTYAVRFRLGDDTIERGFELRKDPRVGAKDEDLVDQYELLLQIRDTHNAVHDGIARTRKIRTQVEPWRERPDVDAAVRELAGDIFKGLTQVEEVLTNPKQRHATDYLKLPTGLDGKLADLPAAIAGADAAPTGQAREVFEKHRTLADSTLARLDEIATEKLGELEARLRETGVALFDTTLPEPELRDQ